MFTVQQRNQIRDELVAKAHADIEIVGAALVGSSATNAQDDLSDIDLALQLAPDADEAEVVQRWTDHIASTCGLSHHLDVYRGTVRYRVYLTPDSLQIDVSFWPYSEFTATGDRFRLLFGSPASTSPSAALNTNQLIGMAWLYALHVRSSIARNEAWHALTLLDDMRNQLLMLACVRYGRNPHQLRGVDGLPVELLARFADAHATALNPDELRHSCSSKLER